MRSRGPTANGEIDPDTKQELEQFEQVGASFADTILYSRATKRRLFLGPVAI
jgi:hypothetical protein